MMSKRSLGDDAQDERLQKRWRPSKPDHLSRLSDELILRILSHLSVSELNLCQRVSYKFRSIACDSQLWKAHYYNRFVRPRASRIPGIRPATESGSSSQLHFSSRLSKWLDEQNLVRSGAQTDWKRQYKLRHNWARGSCHVSEIEVAEQPTIAPLQLRLHESTVYSVDSSGGLRAWSLKGQKRLIAETELIEDTFTPTSLALDGQATEGSPPQIVVGFSNGAFKIFQPDITAGCFKELYAHASSSNGMLVAVAFSFPYLLTMTAGQLLSLYKFPEKSVGIRQTTLGPPRILQSLRSHTVTQPVSLAIRVNSSGITASIAYSVPIVLTTGWSVGLQEMRLTTEGRLIESRLATSTINHGSQRSSAPCGTNPESHSPRVHAIKRPTSISYSHPYLLVSHEDNTLTLYIAISDQNTLTIDSGWRLWGHTSAVSAAHIGGRGRAVSVSQKGGELRVWELERTIAMSRQSRVKLSRQFSVLVRPEELETPLHEDSLGMAKITEAIRKRGDGLGLALEERFEENILSKGLVGFDDENVVVLTERRSGSQALLVYDFT